VGECEDDVEVRDREEVGAAGLDPIVLGEELALGTVAVATGVIDGTSLPAAVTLLEVTAEGRRAAGREGVQDLALER